jgi:S-adenosylmethionine hydrolase
MYNNMKSAIITLSSDFGHQDEYVGVMKGTILSRNPDCMIVDLHHHLDADHIRGAGILLGAAYPFFPAGTVHVIVVDPGVGSDRKIILAGSKCHLFLAPDNGIIPAILGDRIETSYVLDCPELYNKPVSNTFHGRDIMAPVAAELAMGLEADRVGPSISPDDLCRLPAAVNEPAPHQLQGAILHIDHFGNMLTDIKAESFDQFIAGSEKKGLLLSIRDQQLTIRVAETYSDTSDRSLLLIKGSRGYMEISINGRSAASTLNGSCGDIFLLLSAKAK